MPEQGGPGVIVLHAWWELTPFFQGLCDRLAEAGFAAFAPDLNQCQTARTIEEAQKIMEGRDYELTKEIVSAAIEFLRAQPGVQPGELGAIGFSMGASWALVLSSIAPQEIGAVVLFYGVEGVDFASVRAAFLGHYGEDDTWTKLDWSHQMEADMRLAGLGTDGEFSERPAGGVAFVSRYNTPHVSP